MEIVIFIMMMIVPVISIIALVLSLIANKRFKKVTEIMTSLLKQTSRNRTPEQDALDAFKISTL